MPVDKRRFQLVMQDEARHVSCGMQHLKQIEEYFQRLRRAGFEERIERSKFRDLLAAISLTNQEPALAS